MTLIRKFFISLSLLAHSAIILAADLPLPVASRFDLRAAANKITFFELMSHNTKGIKAALDFDSSTPILMTDARTFRAKAQNFAHIEKLQSQIRGGAAGLDFLVNLLAGQQISFNQMYGVLMDSMRKNNLFIQTDPRMQSRLAGALVPVLALTSGKGVLVQLDPANYCYNVGYAKGSGGINFEQDKQDRKTGRSYGASIARNAYDPSDNDYLRGLSKYVSKASDAEMGAFYTVIFQILLKSDGSGIKRLSPLGQTLIADFMAIYMAELDRHLMTGLKMYEWENALTEITMLAAYSTSRDGLTLDPRGGVDNTIERPLIKSNLLQEHERLLGFFGVGTDGSGLDGKNKKRRHVLTTRIASEQRRLNPALIARIESLIGIQNPNGVAFDIYDELMNRVNHYSTQTLMKNNADALIDALVRFILTTRVSASQMRLN